MNQQYLAIARSYMESPQAAPEEDVSEPFDFAGAPEPLAIYRSPRPLNRCKACGLALSVIAVSTLCGRCRAPQIPPGKATPSPIALVRGQVLLELDRLNYPALVFADGRRAMPGLLEWAPLLRAMEASELQATLKKVRKLPRKSRRMDEDGDG